MSDEAFRSVYCRPITPPAPDPEERCHRCQGDGFTVGQGDRFGEPWCSGCGGTGLAPKK
jgi:hypothetical protein